MKKMFVLVMVVAVMAAASQAAIITVINHSFESPAAGKVKGWDNPNQDIPGWSSDTQAADSGVESDWPGSTDGVYAGYLMGSDPSAWQLTDHVIAAGEEYVLKVDLQNNYSDGTPNFQLGLYYDNAGVRVALGSVVINPGSPWAEFSLTAAANASSIGHKLGIELDNISAGGSWIGMDNVRVDAIPEPMTLSLLAFGALALRKRSGR